MPTSYTDQKKNSIRQKAKRRRRRRILIITAIVAIVVIAAVLGGYFLITYRTYDSYSVKSDVELKGASDNLTYHLYGKGFLQCSSSGVTYFTRDEIVWDETFEMSHPLIDVSGDYAAVCDMKQNDIYVYDQNGLVNRISTVHDILDIEISKDGIIAAATNDGDSNYIELKDKNGESLINVKSIFSSSGYLCDIALSDDGNRLAAAFIYVSQGALESKVLFYDFSKSSTDDMLVGGFSQYTDTVLTTVEFMDGDIVCAIGDNAMTFYRFSTVPQIVHEDLDMDWEIQSMSMNNKHILFVIRDDSGHNNYRALVYNTSGEQIADVGFDLAYSRAALAGSNVLLYSQTDCQIYSFRGVKRFTGSFGDRISYILSEGNASDLLLATTSSVRLIRLK